MYMVYLHIKLYIRCCNKSPVIAIKTKDKHGKQQYHNKIVISFEGLLSHTLQETRKYNCIMASGSFISLHVLSCNRKLN
jgi:hypothetical protein